MTDDTLTGARLVEAGSLVTDCDCIATTGALCRDNCPCKRHARAALRAQAAAAGVTAEILDAASYIMAMERCENGDQVAALAAAREAGDGS